MMKLENESDGTVLAKDMEMGQIGVIMKAQNNQDQIGKIVISCYNGMLIDIRTGDYWQNAPETFSVRLLEDGAMLQYTDDSESRI